MSSYKLQAKNKKTGEVVEVEVKYIQQGMVIYKPESKAGLYEKGFNELYDRVEDTTPQWEKEFDALNTEISAPRSLAEVELKKKIESFIPIAFDLLKPSIKQFIRDTLKAERERIVGEIEKIFIDEIKEADCREYPMNCAAIDHLDNVERRIIKLIQK